MGSGQHVGAVARGPTPLLCILVGTRVYGGAVIRRSWRFLLVSFELGSRIFRTDIDESRLVVSTGRGSDLGDDVVHPFQKVGRAVRSLVLHDDDVAARDALGLLVGLDLLLKVVPELDDLANLSSTTARLTQLVENLKSTGPWPALTSGLTSMSRSWHDRSTVRWNMSCARDSLCGTAPLQKDFQIPRFSTAFLNSVASEPTMVQSSASC